MKHESYGETLNRDACIAHEKALFALEKAKEEESRQKQMYSWKRGSLIVAQNSMEKLEEVVKALGYEWSEGRFGEKA